MFWILIRIALQRQFWWVATTYILWRTAENCLLIITKYLLDEPPHEKINKWSVRPAKTQISLGICPVWSECSLCTKWVAEDPMFLHVDSKASDQTGLIWVFAGCTGHFVGFVMRWLISVGCANSVVLRLFQLSRQNKTEHCELKSSLRSLKWVRWSNSDFFFLPTGKSFSCVTIRP